MLRRDVKNKLMVDFQAHRKDSGSIGVQVALLTARINALTSHLKSHKKDSHSRQGLFKMVGARRKLLAYLEEKTPEIYKKLIKRLKLRK